MLKHAQTTGKKKKRLGDSNLLLAISTYDKFLLPECEKVTERHADRKQKAPKFSFFLGQVECFEMKYLTWLLFRNSSFKIPLNNPIKKLKF